MSAQEYPTTNNFSLSNRARNCLERLFSNSGTLFGTERERFAQLNSMTPEKLNRLLFRITEMPPHLGRPVKQVLLMTKNCGRLTAHEILTFVGLADDEHGLHTCVCRYCGKALSSVYQRSDHANS